MASERPEPTEVDRDGLDTGAQEASIELSPIQLVRLFQTLEPPSEVLDRLELSPHGVHLGGWMYTIEEPLDVERFTLAWQGVVDRNPILRTSFAWDDLEDPRQVVHLHLEAPLEQHDWTDRSAFEQRLSLDDLIQEHRDRQFLLNCPPLYRLVLITVEEASHWLFLATHRVLLDEWSVQSLVHELLASYSAPPGSDPGPPPRPDFGQYVLRLRDQSLQETEQFWRTDLEGFHRPIRLERTYEEVGTPHGIPTRAGEALPLPRELATALRSMARQEDLPLETTILAAWAVLVSRYAAEPDIVMGLEVAGRPPPGSDLQSVLGPFRNQIPFRVRVDEEMDVLSWLRAVQVRRDQVARFEYFPEVLIREWSEVPRTGGLFWHTVTFVDRTEDPPLPPALRVRREPIIEMPIVPLALFIQDEETNLEGHAIYCTTQFEPGALERMMDHLVGILEHFVKSPESKLRDISMLTKDDRGRILRDWNATTRPYPKDLCLHQHFERQAGMTPEATALAHGNRHVTYEELNMEANRWANHLQARGVGPEVLVGVHLRRSPEMVAVLLGVLKAGGGYVPLDPAYPAARLTFMMEDARVPMVVSDATTLPFQSPDHQAVVLSLAEATGSCGDPVPSEVSPDNLAYVLYTSGSTGNPKGIAIEHRSVVDLLHWARDAFGSDLDGILATASISFDCSVLELFGPLCWGGKVILAENALDMAALHGGDDVRLMTMVPSVMAELLRTERLPASLRTVILGGEAPWPDLVQEVYTRSSVRRLFNLYGPTECTSYSTLALVGPELATPPSIGRPVSNTRVYILDRYGNPVPVGVPGEVYIGGEGLARGYVHSPALTAERFVPDSLSGIPGARLYRTGDLARYRDDGEILFLGRVDHQVKVRGFRIEPGEVEQALMRYPGVEEAAVLPRREGESNLGLIAYVVPANGAISSEELRGHLRRMLPAHMVPDLFMSLDGLPRTATGKVDRRALPSVAATSASADHGYVPPRDDAEQLLATLWSDVLGVDRVGVFDNFFEIGGDSFLAIRMVSRARDAGLQIDPTDVFENQTVAELAAMTTAGPACSSSGLHADDLRA